MELGTLLEISELIHPHLLNYRLDKTLRKVLANQFVTPVQMVNIQTLADLITKSGRRQAVKFQWLRRSKEFKRLNMFLQKQQIHRWLRHLGLLPGGYKVCHQSEVQLLPVPRLKLLQQRVLVLQLKRTQDLLLQKLILLALQR